MKRNSEQLKQFDDALPERFVRAGIGDEPRKLRIDRGEAAPSPYIVKLSRPTTDTQPPTPLSVTEEIEALAKSFIIDGDDDVTTAHIDQDEELSLDALDISSQLREFDTALPAAPTPYALRPTPSDPSRNRQFPSMLSYRLRQCPTNKSR